MRTQWFAFFSLRFIRRPAAALRVTILMIAVVVYGATGFLNFELPGNPDLDWPTAFWYAVVTVTTVGYGDFAPATVEGRYLVAVPLMFFGIGLLGYVLSLSASRLVQAKTKELTGMSQVKLTGHLVIFNFPSVGKICKILEELRADPDFEVSMSEVVLVDEDLEELPPELADRGVRYVRGNPTRDETLSRANLDHASHAIVLSKRPRDPHSDDLSIAITLAIEGRQSSITSVVECVDAAAEELMRKAGCDRIVCTSRFEAHFLSQEVVNPGVQEVVAQLTSTLLGQQVYVTPYSGVATYAALSDRCRRAGHLLVGLRDGAGLRFNLPGN
ncbi:MAG: hypothetical protein RJA70_4037, partial [Pseudomonadota bacterium]